MFLKLIRWFKGFLVINISGDNAEMLLNATSKNGIKIWSLYCKKQNITGCIGIKDFKKLKKIKRNGSKIKIIKKTGIPFYIYKHKNRCGILIGLIVFFLIIKMLSLHIWSINVIGCKKIPEFDILSSCKELSIIQGIKASKINSQNDAQRLLLIRDDIAWASLNIEGCVLTVNVTEIEPENKTKQQVPCNLKASYEGIIKKIDVTSGNTIVKVGDVVNKGDVLVSGIIERNTSTVFVPSYGRILAATQRSITKQSKFKVENEIPNGIIKKSNMLSIFNIDIPLYLGTVKRVGFVTVKKSRLNILGKPMPIILYTSQNEITEKIKITHSREELVDILSKQIDEEIDKMHLEEYTQTDINITEDENGVRVTKYYNCLENIAYQDTIIVNTVN